MPPDLNQKLDEAARQGPRGDEIRDMFAAISPRYDLLNRVVSGWFDRGWRKKTVRFALDGNGTGTFLDVCSGTGDLAFEIQRQAREDSTVVGIDFCREMLCLARDKAPSPGKGPGPRFLVSDALRLPFASGSFDAALVAFGIRNLRSVDEGIAEMVRVLRPGGRLVILECSRPQNVISRLLLRVILFFVPWIGRALCGFRVDAYRYLVNSMRAFGERVDVGSRLLGAGLRDIRIHPLTLGAVTIYRAETAPGGEKALPSAPRLASRG
jgi:demethylmenaquinone methyltransferase/2-methoxy-6-polyprenyl-1,4-benzoquinol methylase